MDYGCIGEHLAHSFSKEIHNRIGDYDYRITEVSRDELDSFMKKADFKGINVTIPYKQSVIPYLDFIDEYAEKTGAVNTIVNRNGKLFGYNTDVFGMTALINRLGVSLKHKKILITGTGGTSLTARTVAKVMGAEKIITVSRTAKSDSVTYDEAVKLHSDADVIINTTPCGMYPDTDDCPIDINNFPKLSAVIDVVYNPLRTNLVLDAMSKGIKAEGGLYMLVSQAVKSSELFFSTTYDDKTADNIFSELLSEKENIVLSGMPGCGKSTVGKLISCATGRELIDTDELCAGKAGMSIPGIFEKYGEEYFRKLESEVINDISPLSGKIISPGGGSVLSEDNVRKLKMNGRVYFIDRNPEEIIVTDGRPLTGTKEQLMALYKERYDTYCSTADVKIVADGTAEETAAEIERRHGV